MTSLRDLGLQYTAFAENGLQEASRIVSQFEAQMLSRTGFVFDEMKGLQHDIVREIQDRATNIGDPSCLVTAAARLQVAAETSGSNSQAAFKEVLDDFLSIRFILVYPELKQLLSVVSRFINDPFRAMSRINGVTNMNDVIMNIEGEIELYESLFEDFVSELILEFRLFDNFNHELNMILFESLEETRLQFHREYQGIMNFLNTECN